MPRIVKYEPKITGPMTLDDLRWLVEQCVGLDGESPVTVKEHKTHSPTDYDEASITVLTHK